MNTLVPQHFWVEMKYTPLEVTKGGDGELRVSITDTHAEAAKQEALLGCWFCHTPLNTDTFDSYCEPELENIAQNIADGTLTSDGE